MTTLLTLVTLHFTSENNTYTILYILFSTQRAKTKKCKKIIYKLLNILEHGLG